MKTAMFEIFQTTYTVQLDHEGILSVFRGKKVVSSTQREDWSTDDVELESSRISQEEGIDESELVSAMRYVISCN